MNTGEPPTRFKLRREAPVVIGGVGGSGTRVVAELLKEMGFYLGKLNTSNDNRTFASLFRRPQWLIRNHKRNPEAIHWAFRRFEREMFDSGEAGHPRYQGWGWKNPVTHIYLNFLNAHFPRMKYIHVIRHGLDIAFSGNKNQLRLWGKLFHIKKPETPRMKPKSYLQYWIRSNRRAIRLGRQLLGNRLLVLKYNDLCLHPKREIHRIIRFLELNLRHMDIHRLSRLIQRPESIGRYKKRDLSLFDTKEIQAVRNFGFAVDPFHGEKGNRSSKKRR
ncbi:sulfotransferase family protein [Paludifilum halophilum]|nr:sulfotransferase [Paludifilum halophilum]